MRAAFAILMAFGFLATVDNATTIIIAWHHAIQPRPATLHALPAPRYSAECALGDMDQDELRDADLDRAASRCWEDV